MRAQPVSNRLVIERHYEPLPPEEAAEMLHRVYGRILDVDLLERLTQHRPRSTIPPDQEEAHEGSALRAS
jgi:hypothetical protein